MHNYIHSGEIEELSDVIPFEDFTDYSAEDFIEDHAIETVGDEEDADPNQRDDEDEDDFEPSSKRFRSDFDSYDNEESNDYDSRYGREGPGIPSLLNLSVNPPRRGQESKNVTEKPPASSPWESASFNNNNNNGAFGGNQSSNNHPHANNDRRDREGRRGGSRWSRR